MPLPQHDPGGRHQKKKEEKEAEALKTGSIGEEKHCGARRKRKRASEGGGSRKEKERRPSARYSMLRAERERARFLFPVPLTLFHDLSL